MINRMAVEASDGRPILNAALREQLKLVAAFATEYIADDAMPHERGSIDTFDDMRNSMGIAVEMMHGVLDATHTEPAVILTALQHYGPCAVAEGVTDLAFPGKTEEELNELIYGEEVA